MIATIQNFQISRTVRTIIERDGALLLDIRQDLCFSLNPVGTRIWELLRDGSGRDAIKVALEGECSAPAERIGCDVDVFLQELAASNLIVEGKNPAQ